MAKERKDTPSGANQFSVYAQRDTDSTQVDWGVIAKDLTTEVKRISEDRAKRRNDIEVSTQEAMKELSLVADLDNQSVNGFVIRGGNFSKNALQTQMELLRNGAIKPEEYQLFMQQQKDGYANLSLFAKNADDKYKAAMERLKNGEDGNQIASELEIVFNEGTFDYTDLKNKQLITNPSTGEMLIVTLQDDGNGNMVIPDLKKNPELYQSLATLNNRTAFQLDRRDTGKLTTAAVADLGDVVISTISDYTVLGGGGVVEKTTGIRQAWDSSLMNEPGAYDKWMSDSVDVIAGKRDNPNNFNAMQVLANTGVKLSLKDEPGTIQYRTNGNGMPELMMTPEQIDQARDIVQKQIESKLIQKIEFTKGMSGQQPRPKSAAETNERNIKKDKIHYIKEIDKVRSGDTKVINNMAITANAQRESLGRPKIVDIDQENAEFITVTYDDGTSDTQQKGDAAAENIFLYNILVPGAQREGGANVIAGTTEAMELTKANNYNMPDGVSSFYSTNIQDAETLTSKTSVLSNDRETSKTPLEHFGNKFGADIGTLETYKNIVDHLNAGIEYFTTPNAIKARSKAGISNVRYEKKNDGLVIVYEKDGKSVEGEVKFTPNDTTMIQLADMFTEDLNRINKATTGVTPNMG
tara:strand:- start:28 stop:1938 length:1911 start_codon:yes stop_codon:yes gene_type:complete